MANTAQDLKILQVMVLGETLAFSVEVMDNEIGLVR